MSLRVKLEFEWPELTGQTTVDERDCFASILWKFHKHILANHNAFTRQCQQTQAQTMLSWNVWTV